MRTFCPRRECWQGMRSFYQQKVYCLNTFNLFDNKKMRTFCPRRERWQAMRSLGPGPLPMGPLASCDPWDQWAPWAYEPRGDYGPHGPNGPWKRTAPPSVVTSQLNVLGLRILVISGYIFIYIYIYVSGGLSPACWNHKEGHSIP